MYKILIADDEQKIRELVKKYAVFEGHEVTQAQDGMEAVAICREQDFDIIILDIMMPELDGFSACREIRKIKDTPILMLSARGEEYDRINGFETGADDYVVKPFSPKELMLRIDAIIRRSSSQKTAQSVDHDVFVHQGLKVDFTARLVYIEGVRAVLSPKEYDLLFYLVKNKGRALSRENLITEVWGYDYYGDDRTLDTHIKLLRKSVGDYARFIVTLRGVGYRFETDKDG
ncbi:MAG: DNA-binding response regulator [Clostridiales bacterium 43-6]|nr:MAG: DNA-binding response regulator [Clostridiales bacterium 43-6]